MPGEHAAVEEPVKQLLGVEATFGSLFGTIRVASASSGRLTAPSREKERRARVSG